MRTSLRFRAILASVSVLRRRLRLLPAALLALLATAAVASELPPGVSLRWPPSGYFWHYNHAQAPAWLSPEEGLALARAAADSWLPCTGTLHFAGLTASPPGIMDNENVVGWKNDGSTHSGWTSWKARRTGEALEADITLYANIFDRYRLRGIDARLELKKTLIHEFGHVLGLQHSETPSDVMSVRHRTRPEWQLPSAGDLAACRQLHHDPLAFPDLPQ